ncbi:hypothetical protein IL306_002360 [Fusarium sp. DS 682]|nr:hypothetical protein IL306_002360 [Fusarium sp. DS 682]
MAIIQAAMAQLLPSERQAHEGKALFSLNASISRTLFAMDPQCPLALQLRKVQTEIRRHMLATLAEEANERGETDQSCDISPMGPEAYSPAYAKNFIHPDTAMPSIERDSDSESVELALSMVRVTTNDARNEARCAKVYLPLRPVAISISSTSESEEQQIASATMDESDTSADQSTTSKKRTAVDEVEPVAKHPKRWLSKLASVFTG